MFRRQSRVIFRGIFKPNFLLSWPSVMYVVQLLFRGFFSFPLTVENVKTQFHISYLFTYSFWLTICMFWNHYTCIFTKLIKLLPMYKVVKIWPGRFVCKQVIVCPGHIWTTLYDKHRHVFFFCPWLTLNRRETQGFVKSLIWADCKSFPVCVR
jgi:hypothetical protein